MTVDAFFSKLNPLVSFVLVMISEARSKQWWRNYREPRPVDLLLRGRESRGIAGLVPPDSPEFRDHAASTLRRLPAMGRVFGIDYDRKQGLTDAQVKELGEQIAIVSIALDKV